MTNQKIQNSNNTSSKFENIRRKKRFDLNWKTTTSIAAWTLAIIFICLIGFIIWKSVPGFQHYGFQNIIFSDKYKINDSKSKDASVWLPMAITLLVSFGALLIATPISVKTATFIKFRIKSEKLRKTLRIIVETTVGIPSVIFGLFANQSLGTAISTVFHLNSSYTIWTAMFMLAFMLMPTITSLTINAYDSLDNELMNNSITLGTTKTRAIYKILRRKTRQQIFVAIIIAFGRAIGETMAVSMILSAQNYDVAFANGLGATLKSNLSTLGSVISIGMFSENGGVEYRGLLYAFGIVMFVVVMLLNGIVMFLTKRRKNKHNRKYQHVYKKISNVINFIPDKIAISIESLLYRSNIKLNRNSTQNDISLYITNRIEKHKPLYGIYTIYKLFWEIFAAVCLFGLVSWIVLDILVNGIRAADLPTSTMFKYGLDTTGEATMNTLLLVFISILLTLPFSLLIAIYLNEYAKNAWPKKVMLFFIDSLGATPSIIFGMFGLAFFIQTLGISFAGNMGTSLLAGAFTISIVILPNFVRTIQQSLENVPLSVRDNSYALGNSKWETIRKLVLPMATRGIITSILLSIGRILSETAPLYITAGLSSASSVAIMNPGQTLTTRIYAQLAGQSAGNSLNVMYESALTTLLLVLFLTILSYVAAPYSKAVSKWIRDRYEGYTTWKQINNRLPIEVVEKQTYKSTLYLSNNQYSEFKLNSRRHRLIYTNKKLIKIKVVDDEVLINVLNKKLNK